ncbi:MAG: radical SAM family heme chaperone HemW, partial [Lachnospiraceae bacterium]|nr:radical SAM family heme chaperone HemW [Lachnospiraceae bacterium]
MELYIHIPFCMKKCAYCDFLSAPHDRKMRARYTDALCREISYYGRHIREPFDTVFIGGGTPSWLEIPLMERIVKAAGKAFTVKEDAEISIEVNPGTVTKDAMEAYASWGINRVSIGLQSANEEELRLLGRVHSYEHFLKTFEIARNAGIGNINVDLMTGLPGQTPDMLLHSIRQVTMLRPEHISAYSLMIEEGTLFFDAYGQDAKRQAAGENTVYLPTEEALCELTDLVEETLSDYGYLQYEISNFAKEGFECRHNLGYWRRVPYLGVGLGAASFYDHTRYANERDIY